MISKRHLSTFAAILAPTAMAFAQEAATAPSPNPTIVLVRWLHILGAAALLGGGIFLRQVLLPSAATLPTEAHDQLRAAVRGRWAKMFGILTAVLLLTGFYNYIVVGTVIHKGQGPYHMLMGFKIILAFGVFGLGSLLAGKTSLAKKLQANLGLWLGVNLGLGAIILLIGAYLRYFPTVH